MNRLLNCGRRAIVRPTSALAILAGLLSITGCPTATNPGTPFGNSDDATSTSEQSPSTSPDGEPSSGGGDGTADSAADASVGGGDGAADVGQAGNGGAGGANGNGNAGDGTANDGGAGNTGGGGNGVGDGNGAGDGGNNAGNTPPGIGGDTEVAFIEAMSLASRSTREIAATRIPNAVYFAFNAGNYTGQGITFVGTLHVSATWQVLGYDPTPADRLIVVEPASQTEYVFEVFNGNTSGVAAFTNYHAELTFRVRTASENLRITSVSTTGNFWRHAAGTITLPHGRAEVDIVEGGGQYADSEVRGAWQGGYWDVGGASSIRGTVQAAGGSINVFEMFDSRIVNNVLRARIGIGSTGSNGGASYQFQNAYFQFVERSGIVVEPDFWVIQGGLVRDGVTIGTCGFNGPVGVGYYTPLRVLQLVNGLMIGL